MQIKPTSLPPPPPPKASRENFTTAKIENHWNDPPKAIFHKEDSADHSGVQPSVIASSLSSILATCESNADASQKHVLEDAKRRIEPLLKQLENDSVASPVMRALDQICKGFENTDWEVVRKVQGDLMRTEYEKPTGKWVPCIKRLVDLYSK